MIFEFSGLKPRGGCKRRKNIKAEAWYMLQ